MSIFSRLISILGQFWASVCQMTLPRQLCSTLSGIFAGTCAHRQRVIQQSVSAFKAPEMSRIAQTTVYIDTTSIRKAKIPVTSESAQDLAALIGTGADQSEWWASTLLQVPRSPIHILQSSQLEPRHVLVSGVDFYVQGATIYTRVSPHDLGLPAEYVAKPSGEVCAIYAAVSVSLGTYAQHGAFGYITDTTPADYELRRILWRTRIQGLTIANISLICGAVIGVPVIEQDGQCVLGIDNIGDYWFVYTSRRCYLCSQQPDITVGAELLRGTSLCSGMRIYTQHNYKQCSELLSLQVQTPVGMLQAQNTQLACVDAGILPLTATSTASYQQYAAYIKTAYTDYEAGGVPASVNPAAFIIDYILRQSFVLLVVDNMPSAAVCRQLFRRLRQQCPVDSVLYICDLTSGTAQLLYNIIQEI